MYHWAIKNGRLSVPNKNKMRDLLRIVYRITVLENGGMRHLLGYVVLLRVSLAKSLFKDRVEDALMITSNKMNAPLSLDLN